MKYIGNYSSYVPGELIKNLKDSEGNEITDYQMFDSKSLGIDIRLPNLPEQRESVVWNIFKFNPGQLEYVYSDNFLSNSTDSLKYIMFLNDWEIGHIFTCDQEMLTNFKAGDIYQLDNRSAKYSWANIGYSNLHFLEIKMTNNKTEITL